MLLARIRLQERLSRLSLPKLEATLEWFGCALILPNFANQLLDSIVHQLSSIILIWLPIVWRLSSDRTGWLSELSSSPPIYDFRSRNYLNQLSFDCAQLCSYYFQPYSLLSDISAYSSNMCAWVQLPQFVSLALSSIVNFDLKIVSINWILIMLNHVVNIFDLTGHLF